MDALTLRLTWEGGDEYQLVLTSPYLGREEEFSGIPGYSNLEKLASVRPALEALTFRGRLSAPLTPHRCASLLEEFRVIGSTAFITLLGGIGFQGRQQRFQRYVEDVLRLCPNTTKPTLTVVSPVDLPVELMTVLDTDRAFSTMAALGAPPGARLLQEAAACFIGFRFVVRKVGKFPRPSFLALGSNGRVAVAPYLHCQLRNANKSLAQLQAMQRFTVRLPTPTKAEADAPAAGRDIARRLVQESAEDTGIVHLWGHCDAGESVTVLQHRFILAAEGRFGRAEEVSVTVAEIRAATRHLDATTDGPAGPLAFVSACGAANISYEAPFSIPEALLSAGYRAVIAPLVSMHVAPALGIASAFFLHLHSRSQCAGLALLEARCDLLREFCTPIGLLYSCYGEVDLNCA